MKVIEYILFISLLVTLIVCSLTISDKKRKGKCPKCNENKGTCCCDDFEEECFNMEK